MVALRRPNVPNRLTCCNWQRTSGSTFCPHQQLFLQHRCPFSDFHCALGHICLINLNKIGGQQKVSFFLKLHFLFIAVQDWHTWRCTVTDSPPEDLVFMCATAEVSALPIRVAGCCGSEYFKYQCWFAGIFHTDTDTGISLGFTTEKRCLKENGSKKMPHWCQRSEVRVGRVQGWRSIFPETESVIVSSVKVYDTSLWVGSCFFVFLITQEFNWTSRKGCLNGRTVPQNCWIRLFFFFFYCEQ